MELAIGFQIFLIICQACTGLRQPGIEFLDHLERLVGFLGLAQAFMPHILLAVDVGHVLPGVGNEPLVDGGICTADIRVGLLDMDDSRIGIERFTESERDDAVVETDGSTLELEILIVVEDLEDGLALPGNERVIRLILQAQLVPVVEFNLAGRDDLIRDGQVLSLRIEFAERVEMILLGVELAARERRELFSFVDVIPIVAVIFHGEVCSFIACEELRKWLLEACEI